VGLRILGEKGVGRFQGLAARAAPQLLHFRLLAEMGDGMEVQVDGGAGK
jgi:hypothetical protein